MAERDFYNVNDFISYPLVHDDDTSLDPSGVLPSRGLVDAGFTFGLDSEFDAVLHHVHLYQVVVGSSVRFDFRSNAPGLLGYRWLFDFPADSQFGGSMFVEATDIVTGLPSPDRGTGFLTVGDLSDYLAAPGAMTLAGLLRVEPALLHSLVNTYARSIALANDKRSCTDECRGSSSSSSSSSSANADTAFLAATGLVGDLKFKEGYNARITVFGDTNTIELNAAVGDGAGEPCYNLLVDEKGLRQDINECVKCGDLIRSINGLVSSTGKFTLSGGAKAEVLPDPVNHTIVVKIKAEAAC